MNRIATALLLTLSLPLCARADEASHRAKALELMTILSTQQVVDRNVNNLKSQLNTVASNTIGPDPTPAKKAEAEDFVKQAGQMIDAKLSWSAMQSGIIDIYVKNFTEEQLDAIVAFYKTPTGATVLATLPTVGNQIAALGNQRMTSDVQPKLIQLVATFRQKETPAPALQTLPATPSAPAPTATPAVPSTPKAPAPAK